MNQLGMKRKYENTDDTEIFRIMKTFSRKPSKHLETNTQLFTIVVAILIGILGAFGAILFRFMIKFAYYAFFRTDSYTLDWIRTFPYWERMLLPVFGGLLVGPIVFFLAKEVRGSGIPEVIEATAFHGGAIRPRVMISKMLAAAITIGSGGSAGREGPIVQIGSSIGSALGQWLRVSGRKLRTFTACGAAAGIAATFNAPIAGALFSIEVILGDFAVHQFSPIVIASVTATVISRAFWGYFPAFHVPEYHLINSFEFLPYSVLGITAGIVAVAFIKTMSLAQDIGEKIPLPGYLKPALGGLVVGGIGIVLPQVYGVGYETTNNALWGKESGAFLLLIIAAKILATSATLGSGGSGGIFAPALLIGAALGAFTGNVWHTSYPHLTAEAGAYALVGMGAVVSGVTHAPISSILIVFEMTNDYRILPPLMVSCILSILVASCLCRESMYTMKLVKKGINIRREKEVNLLKNIVVHDVYTTDIATVRAESAFQDMVQIVEKHPTHEVFVVNNRHELVGIVSFVNIRNVLLATMEAHDSIRTKCVRDFANTDVPPLFPSDTLDLAIQQFGKINEDELPVVLSPDNRRLIGSVRLRDVIAAYNREVHQWDLTGGIHTVLTAVTRERHLHLADDACIAELDLPDGFLGRSLETLDVRKQYHIHILLVHKAPSAATHSSHRPQLLIPTPEYVFAAGDKILVLGAQEDVEHLQKM